MAKAAVIIDAELKLMDSIKGCPFCGGGVWFHDAEGSSPYVYVSCRICPAEMLVSSLELAVKLWNRRET